MLTNNIHAAIPPKGGRWDNRVTAQDTNNWYVIAGDGDVVVRVHAGMLLGEAAGELSFEAVDAQLKLDIDHQGDLMVSMVEEGELECEDPICRVRPGCITLERGSRAEISLDQNVLQLATDFTENPPASERLQIRAVRTPRLLANAASSVLPKEPANSERVTPSNPAPRIPPSNAGLGPRPAARRPTVEPEKVDVDRTKPVDMLPIGTLPHVRHRHMMLLAVGLLLLTVIGFLLVEPDTSEDSAPIVSSNADLQAKPQTPPAEVDNPAVAAAGSAKSASQELESEPVAAQTMEPPEDPVTGVVGTAPAEYGANAPVEQKSDAANPFLTTENSQPDPVVVVEREAVRDTRPDRSAQLMLERDLLAAELALAQDRLMTPTETSAFTLFNRVLAAVPDSPQAKKGLDSVRERLINRAFAQLAGRAWDDARGTLQVAADAGAHPALIADLRGEVEFGQRLANAQAGRFGELYAFEGLVPISQSAPRVGRYRFLAVDAVEVHFTVTAGGDVTDIEVLGDPPKGLEQALQRVLSQWRFEPVLYNGRPLPVRTSVAIPLRN